MSIYNIFTAICFALLTVEVIYVAVNLIVKNRVKRIAYIRSFKRGKCLIIFISALPLYFMGYMYDGVGVFNSLIETFGEVSNLVFLNFSVSPIQSLMDANIFFRITIYYCFILVTINAVLFAVSILGQRLWLWRQALKMRNTTKNRLFILGYNDNSVNIYRSDAENCKVIAGEISPKDGESLYSDKIHYVSCRDYKLLIDKIFEGVAKRPLLNTVIVNTENDDTNIAVCNTILDKIANYPSDKQCLFERLRVCVFGDAQYADIYSDIVDRGMGCIRYVNKYQKVAVSFIDRYPFTEFMDERHIDYATACVRPNVDINVCMIGFGKVNRQIFLTSVANNQFITKDESGVHLKQVNYHLFDKVMSQNNKNFNHNYYRFRNECIVADADKYLPFPELPANEHYYHLDINDGVFYNLIHSIVKNGENNVNLAIIAFGSDLENIDMARKLLAKRREWNIENFEVLVRVSDFRNEEYSLDDPHCHVFGDEKNDVYSLNCILNDKIFNMAHRRNELYRLEKEITSGRVLNDELIATNRKEADQEWFQKKDQIERDSNLFCCLSLRSKLNMMGLDYCKVSTDRAELSEEEYLALYSYNDPIPFGKQKDAIGKRVIDYSLNFPDSLRKNLALQEHYRWNSYMISQGMIPSTKDEILYETTIENGKVKHTNGKNYQLRRHGNITTFDGLVQFRRMITARDHNDEEENDVIKYDYQLMDDAYWLLTQNEYKIVKKQ